MPQINSPRLKQNCHVVEEAEATSTKKRKEEAEQALYIVRI
jgi:hypothetical protein